MKISLFKTTDRLLKNGDRIHFNYGSAQTIAKAVLLDKDSIGAGESAFVQLRFDEPLAVKRTDRFIIRFYSPVETFGGGIILDACPGKHKRHQEELINALAIRETGTDEEVLELVLKEESIRFPSVHRLAAKLNWTDKETEERLEKLKKQKKAKKEREKWKNAETKGAAFDFYGKLPLTKAVPLGLQHVLAMFVGNLTPILIITRRLRHLEQAAKFAELQVDLLQNAMLVAGIVTLVQLYAIGPVGGKVPIIMGTSSGFIGVFNSVAKVMGGGIAGYGAIMLASVLGGLFETVLGFLLKPLRRFFPAVVTGTVVLSIGPSLVSVGVNSFGGGNTAADFGSIENLALGALVTVVIIAFKHGTKGMTSASSILIGIIAGYIASAVMGLFLSPTGITADGVEYTKAWVLNWDKVAEASWFFHTEADAVPLVFDLRAIVPVLIMFIVTAVETVGDISGVMEGGMGREATDSELSGGVICDGLGSSFAALFGVLPNTSFSQNVGLVAMTKIVNRHALATGAVFLVFCGLLPKLAALISIMPQSVLGGAAVMMFSSIVISGIQLITKEPLTARNITIVSTALGLGYGIGANGTVIAGLPEAVQLIFGGSGIVPAAILAIVLNIVIPREKKA